MFRSVLVIAALFASGCGGSNASPVPTTHPAKGKLLDKAGQPVKEGSIEFVSTGATSSRATSDVAADGSFSLSLMTADGKKYAGAEEGEYRVTYYPVMKSANQSEAPVTLSGTQKIPAGGNESLSLKLP
jgi:hypothetical protein